MVGEEKGKETEERKSEGDGEMNRERRDSERDELVGKGEWRGQRESERDQLVGKGE